MFHSKLFLYCSTYLLLITTCFIYPAQVSNKKWIEIPAHLKTIEDLRNRRHFIEVSPEEYTAHELVEAARSGELETVKTLLANGAPINLQSPLTHTSALGEATRNNLFLLIQRLVAKGAHIDEQDSDGNSLILRHVNGHNREDTVIALLNAGINRSIQNKKGETFDTVWPKSTLAGSTKIKAAIGDQAQRVAEQKMLLLEHLPSDLADIVNKYAGIPQANQLVKSEPSSCIVS